MCKKPITGYGDRLFDFLCGNVFNMPRLKWMKAYKLRLQIKYGDLLAIYMETVF